MGAPSRPAHVCGPSRHSNHRATADDQQHSEGPPCYVFLWIVAVHPETKADPNTIDKRIIHPGLVAVPKYRTRPEARRDIYVWPYMMNPVFKDGWRFSNGPPIVAGVIALMRGANPKLTPAQIRSILAETADDKDGFAVLNAEAAVKKAVDLRD